MNRILVFLLAAGFSASVHAKNTAEIGLDGNSIPSNATISANIGGVSSPAGEITIFLTACPAGYTEETTLSGKFLLGTINAKADVTQAGGNDNMTPAGTNGTVSFTPVGTNAAITAGTPAGTISALTTGADSSTTGGVAKAVAQTPTFTGSALGTHTHVFTGSAGTVPAETFTGTQFDNRPAFVKVIFCRKL